MNAYLNAGIYLNWSLSRYFDFIIGGDFTHFSNGNTKFPNAGLNSVGLRAGLTYNFGRNPSEAPTTTAYPAFPRHFSYDLTLFGSWRRKGIEDGDIQVAAPDAYTVVGFNFASMYNFGYKFRAGVSLDGVYDGSANVAIADQYLCILLTGNMFRDVYDRENYERRLLSRTTEEAVTVTSVLVPWNTCGMTQSTVLGVATTTYLPYCFFNIISPIMSVVVAAIGYKIFHKGEAQTELPQCGNTVTAAW